MAEDRNNIIERDKSLYLLEKHSSNFDVAKQYRICEDWIYLNYPDLFE